MSPLTASEAEHLKRLLRVFFSLPYSTDLDGKDVETLLRIVKGAEGPLSRRKELFDIVIGTTGYSVKTLQKSLASRRVDLQEQRFCDTKEMDELRARMTDNADEQGALLLNYMMNRISSQMEERGITDARSAILLKNWDRLRTKFVMRYWEEDFYGYIKDLSDRNDRGEVGWVIKGAGLHGQDKMRGNVRLLRMHYKHNQIFTDHDIPSDALELRFDADPIEWDRLHDLLYPELVDVETVSGPRPNSKSPKAPSLFD